MAREAYVRRFRDEVAVSLPGHGSTVYLTPGEARILARAIGVCARNIKVEPDFLTSTFVSVSIPISHKG
jgi:hypothetical protein